MMTSRIERERFEFAMHGIHVDDVSWHGDSVQHMYHRTVSQDGTI
jgi:hypothetical protein